MTTEDGSFVWYELMTGDPAAAEDFYAKVVGWKMVDSSITGVRYTLAQVGDRPVGGLMGFPPGVPDPKPAWLGYILVDDVDAMTERVKQAGGAMYRAPDSIPTIGRFSVVADPQGAVFMLFRGEGTPSPELAPETPGRTAWHELHTRDWEKAFAFYEGLFGWKKADAMDMGPMGTYQIFAIGDLSVGAMFNNPEAPAPFWLYYFTVENIDAALERATSAGAKLINGPMEVPGGMWIINAIDPQGAIFALVGPRS